MEASVNYKWSIEKHSPQKMLAAEAQCADMSRERYLYKKLITEKISFKQTNKFS